LYTKVIEDIPLMVSLPTSTKVKSKKVSPNSTPKYISHVTVHFEQAQEPQKHSLGEEMVYAVTWRIHDKNGQSGTYRIFNSFSL
jgi:hypothetical protein